jgi:membrane-bound lytic murein transglycosylase B
MADVRGSGNSHAPRHRARRTGIVVAALALTPLGIVAVGAAPEFADAQQHSNRQHPTDSSWDAVFSAGSSRAAALALAAPVSTRPARPAVIKASVRQRVAAISLTTRFNVPAAAVRAYRSAAQVMRAADPGCHLTWGVLAGIGQVESNHGRFGGSALRVDGTTTRTIVGPRLDGKGVARIPDSDHGRLDGDKRWDRAVGPMQFLPSTWAVVGVDADHTGRADPNDINDAALAAGVYLCASGNDLSNPQQATAAVMTYNHSAAYAHLVLALAAAYDQGKVPVVSEFTAPAFETTPIAGHGPSFTGRHHSPRRPHAPASHPAPPAHHRPVHHKPPTGPTDPTTPVAPAPVTGVLTACDASGPTGTAVPEHHYWCIGSLVLNLGTDTGFSQPVADFDQDGTVQSAWAELQGLVAGQRPVTVTFDANGLVTTINTVAYTPPAPDSTSVPGSTGPGSTSPGSTGPGSTSTPPTSTPPTSTPPTRTAPTTTAPPSAPSTSTGPTATGTAPTDPGSTAPVTTDPAATCPDPTATDPVAGAPVATEPDPTCAGKTDAVPASTA